LPQINRNVGVLEFCDDCGTVLRERREGIWCPKCKKLTQSKSRTRVRMAKRSRANAIHVLDSPKSSVRRVPRTCPKCKNEGVYQWFSSVSGEHAGVRRERTVEHYRCTNCAHSWSESR